MVSDDELELPESEQPELGDEPEAGGFDLELDVGEQAWGEEEELELEVPQLSEIDANDWQDHDEPRAFDEHEFELLAGREDLQLDDDALGAAGLAQADEWLERRGVAEGLVDRGSEIDDGGALGAQGLEEELDESAVSDDGDDAEGPEALDAAPLPPWSDLSARLEEPGAPAPDFDFARPALPAGALAVGLDADGGRLIVLEQEEGAVFLSGERVLTERVPELPLAGIALHGTRPVYWVEGEGLLREDFTEVPNTSGLTALAVCSRGLLLGLASHQAFALALWPEGGAGPECIAALRKAPVQIRASAERVGVQLDDGEVLVFVLGD